MKENKKKGYSIFFCFFGGRTVGFMGLSNRTTEKTMGTTSLAARRSGKIIARVSALVARLSWTAG